MRKRRNQESELWCWRYEFSKSYRHTLLLCRHIKYKIIKQKNSSSVIFIIVWIMFVNAPRCVDFKWMCICWMFVKAIFWYPVRVIHWYQWRIITHNYICTYIEKKTIKFDSDSESRSSKGSPQFFFYFFIYFCIAKMLMFFGLLLK